PLWRFAPPDAIVPKSLSTPCPPGPLPEQKVRFSGSRFAENQSRLSQFVHNFRPYTHQISRRLLSAPPWWKGSGNLCLWTHQYQSELTPVRYIAPHVLPVQMVQAVRPHQSLSSRE